MPEDSYRSLDAHFDAVMQRREILIPALDALASELPAGRARAQIRQLSEVLDKAQSSQALRRQDVVVQWLPLLTAGFSADAGSRLSDLVAGAARESENRRRRQCLVAYPLAVMFLAAAVFAFLCVMVVPAFHSIFDEIGLMLPRMTRMVFFVSDELLHHPVRFLLGVGLVVAAIYGSFRLWTHFALTTRWLGTFVAGNSGSVSAMATLAGQLADLIQIGVDLPDALWLAGQGCRNYQFRRVIEQLARFAHDGGQPLSQSPGARYLPPNLIYALQPAADTGPSIPLLRQLAVLYGDRVGGRFDWAGGATAQLAIVLVGIAVGFVVLAIFAPLVSLISALT